MRVVCLLFGPSAFRRLVAFAWPLASAAACLGCTTKLTGALSAPGGGGLVASVRRAALAVLASLRRHLAPSGGGEAGKQGRGSRKRWS
jgi:hypothetical protein